MSRFRFLPALAAAVVWSAALAFSAALASSAALAAPAAPAGAPPVLVNEIYYDHPGADAGYEFVELVSVADSTVSLAGYRLLAGDGAGPGRWRALWQGQPGDVLAPRARFVIGELLVSPPPDRVLTLALENGPDALRLSAPDGLADTVGYGPLTYAEYFAGEPAPDVPGGYSLARSPDGAETGKNARDFIALSPPTPGAANRPERDAELIAPGPWPVPEIAAPGEPLAVRVVARNRGIGPLAAGELRVLLWCAEAPSLPPDPDALLAGLTADSLLAEQAPADPLEAGDSTRIEFSWTPPAPGAYRLAVTARLEDDGVEGNHRLEAYARAGIGPLVVSEVLYAPAPGEPEWVEVRNRDQAPVDLLRFRLEDGGGHVGRPAPGSVLAALEPDSFAILTEDAAALCALRPALDPLRVLAVQPWPALNNTAGEAGAPADRVLLRDERGLLSDAMSYAGGASGGYSMERRDPERAGGDPANWGLSALPGGTPLAPNSLPGAPPADAGLALSARCWRRAAGARLTVSYRLAWERAVLRLAVIDARGRERARLYDGPSAATGFVEWDGKDAAGLEVGPGAYALAMEARPAAGGARVRRLAPLVVEP